MNTKDDEYSYKYLLIILVIAGAFLRLYNLGYCSLWLDEATTYRISSQSFVAIWQTVVNGEVNPPLFYWVEHVMLTLGNDEILLRLVSAIFGILTIPLFFIIGTEFLDEDVGIVAAAACTISPFLIYYSQEARAFSMMLFFIALATIFYIRALKSSNWKQWALFGIFSALAFWSHFYSIVMITALVFAALVYVITFTRNRFENIKIMLTGVFTFLVLSIPLFFIGVKLFEMKTAYLPTTYGVPASDVITGNLFSISGFSEIALQLTVILFIFGVSWIFVINKHKGMFIVLITVITFAVSYVLALKIPMEPRYLIFFTIPFFTGIAAAHYIFAPFVGKKWAVCGIIAILLISTIPVLAGENSGMLKSDWRGFSATLAKDTNAGDIVVVIPGYASQIVDYYYSSGNDHTTEYGATSKDELENLYSKRENSTIYFVTTADIFTTDTNGEVQAWLKNNTRGINQTGEISLFVSSG